MLTLSQSQPLPLTENETLRDALSNVSERERESFEHAMIHTFCDAGALICMEGQLPEGIFILREGRAKEICTSTEGKAMIVRLLGPGDMIGLTAILAGTPYDTTVEALEPSEADFITRRDFMALLAHSETLVLSVIRQLGRNCHTVYDDIRRLGHLGSVPGRLANMILGWSRRTGGTKAQTRQQIRVLLTHQEIAQIIGSTRESVTRILSYFRQKGWMTIRGATWTITDRVALRALVTAEHKITVGNGLALTKEDAVR
jgi:CRP/FNR family transcriptional regulator, cyclic AMP receptor protein